MLSNLIVMIISIVILIIISGLSVITLWKTQPTFIEDKNNDIDWGLVVAYSILFGTVGASIFLIVFIQVYKVKQRKSINPYKSKIFLK